MILRGLLSSNSALTLIALCLVVTSLSMAGLTLGTAESRESGLSGPALTLNHRFNSTSPPEAALEKARDSLVGKQRDAAHVGVGSPAFPALREYAAMAWDPVASYVVLFGGSNLSNPDTEGGYPNLNDTWTYANGSWSEVFPASSPPPMDFGAMSYDSEMGAIILFGGQIAGPSGAIPVNTTWEFNAGTWTNISNAIAPSPRLGASLAQDPTRGGLVLFGGSQSFPETEVSESDTWTFTNSGWSNITASISGRPPARFLAAMTYDLSASGVLLFGGWVDLGGTAALNDTWILGPNGWTNVTVIPAPNPAGGFSLAYLSETNSAILYGGWAPSLGVDYNQTWSYGNGSWTRLRPPESPPGTFTGTFADDPVSGYGVLLLGQETPNAPASEQTWLLARGNWSIAGSNASLPSFGAGSMAYDVADQELVLVPNSGTGFASGSTDTWVFSGGNWSRLNATVPESTLLVYDASDGYLLGFATNYSSTSTWMFSHDAWTKLSPPTSPPPSESGAIAYDPADGYVLYLDTGSQTTSWRWSAGSWAELNLSTEPQLGAVAEINTMTYDAADGYVVLAQASNSSCGTSGDCLLTWTYSNGAWTDVTDASSPLPPPLAGASVAYDSSLGKVVLFGGRDTNECASCVSNATWTYLAGHWEEPVTTLSPPARYYPSLAYDSSTQRLIMFSGVGVTSGEGGTAAYPLADMWQYAGDNWTEILPSISSEYSTLDVGISTSIAVSTVPSFGAPRFTYAGLPEGCGSSNMSSFSCTPSEPGDFNLTASIEYSNSAQSSATVELRVHADPSVSEFSVSNNPANPNQTITFSSTVSGGTPPFAYSYAGLPLGCASANSSYINCTPRSTGTFEVRLAVTDQFNLSADGALTLTISNQSISKPGPAFGWLSSPLVSVVIGGIVAGMVCSIVAVRRSYLLRREGEEMLEDIRRAISRRPPL
jgi:hypothetical protein